jgi:hypothetical protein
MLRRFGVLRNSWKDKTIFPRDNRGRFNVEDAAAALDIDPDYAKAMYKPIQNTFSVRWHRYPAEGSRTSRPGQNACRRKVMLPLLEKNKKVDRMRNVDYRSFTTF